MNIDINKIESPNLLGELLRHLVFVPKDKYGCYSTFKLEEGFIEINPFDRKRVIDVMFGDPVSEELIKEFKPKIFRKEFFDYEIIVAWYWDGDGTLYFCADDIELINRDCKKDHEWEFIGE